MKKILITGLMLSAFNAFADECISTGQAYVHATGPAGGGFTGGYVITNISNETINVKVALNNPDGPIESPSANQYKFHFSTANTPLSAEGAMLEPGQQGEFYFHTYTQDIGVGKISWESKSKTCIDKAVFASTIAYYSVSGRYGYTLNAVNGGQPF
ncbi:hypothetical protein OE749_11255 [Aestuariibacter sp. AA17]|uniref:Uncharacterized protein n=1 Tax=Fluctibacter corallii TaxID=2984329 RepID=A0ABT3A9B0_9ALTE|nr:hypothetical protein [Aestuariibacter sp. AA17]MCV2885269.1 hypothetical protein [Aestuariibacter sp. AA17]